MDDLHNFRPESVLPFMLILKPTPYLNSSEIIRLNTKLGAIFVFCFFVFFWHLNSQVASWMSIRFFLFENVNKYSFKVVTLIILNLPITETSWLITKLQRVIQSVHHYSPFFQLLPVKVCVILIQVFGAVLL